MKFLYNDLARPWPNEKPEDYLPRDAEREVNRFLTESNVSKTLGHDKFVFYYGMLVNMDGSIVIPLASLPIMLHNTRFMEFGLRDCNYRKIKFSVEQKTYGKFPKYCLRIDVVF